MSEGEFRPGAGTHVRLAGCAHGCWPRCSRWPDTGAEQVTARDRQAPDWPLRPWAFCGVLVFGPLIYFLR